MSKKLFFCGIRGIGMSGLATLSYSVGYQILGSDLNDLVNENILDKINAQIFFGHSSNNVDKSIDIFIKSSVVKDGHVELEKAKTLGIPIYDRSNFLAQLMNLLKKTNIIIAGSHGKTSTTALIGYLYECLNTDPCILVGGIMKYFNTNAKIGNGNYFVLESDESDGSFVDLPVNIGVITSIEEEHMEFYQTYEKLLKYFVIFAKKSIKFGGLVICNKYKACLDVLDSIGKNDNIIVYGIGNNSRVNGFRYIYADNIKRSSNGLEFDIYENNNLILADFKVSMFGEHNVLNALAALCTTLLNQYNISNINKNIFHDYKGVQKRFNCLDQIGGFYIIDDYAHNPTKIKSAIDSARHFVQHGKLIVIFEPHKYSRVYMAFDAFIDSLKNTDLVLVTDFYAASETQTFNMTRETICNALSKIEINNIGCENNSDDIIRILKDNVDFQNDSGVILFVGAGKSTYWAKDLVKIKKTLL